MFNEPHFDDDEDPEPDPDSPPDSVDPAGICPRCGRNSNFRPIHGAIGLAFRGDVFPTDRGRGVRGDPYQRLSVFECMGCNERIAVVEELTVGNKPWRESGSGTLRWPGVHWWPPPTAGSAVDSSVPQRIRDTFSEGLRCLGSSAPRGAAVMFGRTLEAIIRDRGSATAIKAIEGRLADGLDVMAAEGELTKDLAQWAKELRLARNAGGHDETIDDVTSEEARDLSKLLDQLLQNLYVTPTRIRRARESK